MTMRLKILNGRHAGAVVELEAGEQTVGQDSEHEINVTDWTESPLVLICGAGGVVEWRMTTSTTSARRASHRSAGELVRFKPEAFGDIVLCVGPADETWPTDMELLALVFQPERSRDWPQLRSRANKLAALVMSGAVAVAAVVWVSIGFQASSRAAPVPPSLEQLVRELRADLLNSGLPGIEIRLVHGALDVSGLVESGQNARALRELLAGLQGKFEILPRFAVVEELVDAIRDGTGIQGATVRHLGQGSFAVEADVSDIALARAAVESVAVDLAPHVKQLRFIDPRAGERFKGQPVTAAYADDHTSIVQTRDGAIHLVVTSPDESASAPSRSFNR